jgi:hypothetical protein
MGGPKGIDWNAALEFYLTPSLEGKITSYKDVANEFGVSKKEVGLRAKRENWPQRRQDVYDLAKETFTDNRALLINQAVYKHIKTWHKIQRLAERLLNKELSPKDLLQLALVLKISIDGERTALGLPNKINPTQVEVFMHGSNELSAETMDTIDRFFQIENIASQVT